MVSDELLGLMRCTYCVSGATRRAGENPGRLELVHDSWLVCQEPGCSRKYPIVDGIPIMLIATGSKWSDTPVGELPVPPSKTAK